jgi:hypothetical protein
MSHDPSNDFGYWCVITAGLRDRTVADRRAILESLDLAHRWEGIRSQWAHLLLDDVERGDLTRVLQLEEVCAHDRKRRNDGDDAFAGALSQASPTHSVTLGSEGGDAAPSPSVDFRQSFHEPTAAQPPAVEVESDFVARMMPEGVVVQPPRQTQKLTVPSAVDDAVKVTGRAMKWTVERYAAFAAALDDRGPAPAVLEEFEVVPDAVDAIVKGWGRKMEQDSGLQAEYQVHFQRARMAR